MEKLYRIENEEGKGPYSNNETLYLLRHHSDEFYSNHPTPYDDEGIDRAPHSEEICAFKNKEQLRNWFNIGELHELKKMGYKIKRILGKITATGKYQVLAFRIDEKPIHYRSIFNV